MWNTTDVTSQEQDIMNIVLSHTKITKKMYTNKSRTDWYIGAKEAKKLGCCDFIIGEDCDFDFLLK